MNLRRRIAQRLHFLADRIAPGVITVAACGRAEIDVEVTYKDQTMASYALNQPFGNTLMSMFAEASIVEMRVTAGNCIREAVEVRNMLNEVSYRAADELIGLALIVGPEGKVEVITTNGGTWEWKR